MADSHYQCFAPPNADTMLAAQILGSGVNNGVKDHFTLATVSER